MLTKYFAIQSNVVAVHAVILVDFVALQAMIMIMTIMMNQRQWSKVKSETAGSASVCPFNRGPTKIADPRNGMGCGNAAVAKLTRAQWTFKLKQKEREMILSVVGTDFQIAFLYFDQLIIGNRNELEEN